MRQPCSEIELLAPAGDLLRAKTAIRYGANAVYLGGKSFSLRSRSSNFTLEEIEQACRYGEVHQARIYVTVNLIPHEEDFAGLPQYLRDLENAGVSALIIASPAIMKITADTIPAMPIHGSTQLSLTNALGARFLKERLHVSRLVLARECSLEQIRQITAATDLETEVFIHGGMCVNYSGRCTLSNRMTLRDANRGGCAQSCRWFYHLERDQQRLDTDPHLFSMGSRDLCAIREIAALLDCGVASLKIEGRMKTEYYVASVVYGYRRLLRALQEKNGVLSESELSAYEQLVLRGENRPACTGFLAGKPDAGSQIYVCHGNDSVSHDFLGTVLSYEAEQGTMLVETRNPFAAGDAVEVLSPGREVRSFRIRWLQNEQGESLEKSRRPMARLRMPVPFAVSPQDLLRKKKEGK